MTISTTTQVDLRKFKDEVLNYTVNKLYALDSKSRYSQTTTTFSGDDATTKFTLSSNLRAITSVSIGADDKSYGTDYLPIFDSASDDRGKIEFTAAPTTGSDNISVTFIEGSDGWIYADFPRKDIAISKYPRIGLGLISTPVEGGLGGLQHVLKNQIRISVLMLSENTRDLDKFDYTLMNNITKDAKAFYNFRYVRPDAVRDIAVSEDTTADVLARNRDYIIPDRYEIVSYN